MNPTKKPAPGQQERFEFEQLKTRESQLDQAKTEALKLLTDIRTEKIRTQKILDELETEKREKNAEKVPTPSAGAAASFDLGGFEARVSLGLK